MNALAQLGLERYMCKIVEIKLLSVRSIEALRNTINIYP